MTFEQRFPEIEEIKVDITQTGYMLTGLRESSLNKYMEMEVGCRNRSCSNGRLYLEPIVRDMVQNQEGKYEDSELCLGKETSMNRDCLNLFEFSISITYKESPAV